MKIKSEIGHRSAPASKEAAEFGLRAEEGEMENTGIGKGLS